MNISSLLSLRSAAARNSAVKKAGRIARRTALCLSLLGVVASAPAAVNLVGTPITIVSCLNGHIETATVILTGTSMQVSQPIFSWMIPGDSFSIVERTNGYDRFGLVLSGNHTFTASDALTITYCVETGTVFDGYHTALVEGYGTQGGLGVSMCGNKMAVQMHGLDTISTGGGWQGLGANIGVVSTVIPGGSVADTAPQAISPGGQFFNPPGGSVNCTPQVFVVDPDSYQVLSLALWENGQVVDVQTVTTPCSGLVSFDSMNLTIGYHAFTVEVSDGFDTVFANIFVLVM
jgi:hypothetical protein